MSKINNKIYNWFHNGSYKITDTHVVALLKENVLLLQNVNKYKNPHS